MFLYKPFVNKTTHYFVDQVISGLSPLVSKAGTVFAVRGLGVNGYAFRESSYSILQCLPTQQGPIFAEGWSGGAMVLGKLPASGRPTNLDNSRARAYGACSRCGRGWFGHFFSHLSFLSSFSQSLGDGPI